MNEPDMAASTSPALQKPVPKEVLTFRLGTEEYGVDILRVQEIRSYEPPTRVANSQPYVKGVTNLRGVIVPILDLRLLLGSEDAQYSQFTVVIVLNILGRVVGVVVDAVSDVVALIAEDVKPAPSIQNSSASSHITGIVTIEDGESERMLVVIDIEAMLSSAELSLFHV